MRSLPLLVLGLVTGGAAVATAGVAATWPAMPAPTSEMSGAVSGVAELDSAGPTRSMARISIGGDQPGATRPWHLHRGTCDQGGAVLGPAGDYLVNVHGSVAELRTIIACGDLHLSGY